MTTTTPQTSKATANRTTRGPLSRLSIVLPWLLIIGGALGALASVIITADKFALLQNSSFQPGCDLNPIISCGSVMQSNQAQAFGFMNTYIGLLGFPVVVTVGMALLAGARLKRWFWLGLQVGLTLGVGFAYWLLFESIYRIGALCPWCLTVDVALTTVWWYVTLYNFYQGYLTLPARLRPFGRFVKRHHADILVFFFLVVIIEILHHFWYYFGRNL